MKTLVILAALLFPTAAAASVEVMPFVGYAWGGTQKFDLEGIRGDIHVNASLEYGLTVGMYGRQYGLDLTYHFQDTEAIIRVDGFGTVASVPVGFHYLVVQISRAYRMGPVSPFIIGGLGVTTLRAAGESESEFAMSLGTGVRKTFGNGGSLRLVVRMLAPLEFTDNGVSFGAAQGGIQIGGASSFFQGDVSLGYSFPIGGKR